MTQRRLSKRSTAVSKRRLLEEKLEKRRISTELRRQKEKSKHLRDLHKEELNEFSEEALRLSNCVDLYLEESETEKSKDKLESTVDEIISEIGSLDNTPEGQDLLNNLPSVLDITKRRRLTSTDFDFLESPTTSTNPRFPRSSWPARFPSQEPEEISLEHWDLVDEVEVFGAESDLK